LPERLHTHRHVHEALARRARRVPSDVVVIEIRFVLGGTVLRIVFTPEDLGRVRLAHAPDPLWETVLATYRMRDHHLDLLGSAWHREAMRRRRVAAVNVLTNLVPGGYYPDFLTPIESHQGLDAGLDALAHSPRRQLRKEVDLLIARRPGPPPSWMHDLREGRSHVVAHVVEAVRQVHDDVVAPWWPQARAQVDGERARRGRAFLDGGVDELLAGLRPVIRWNPPVLEADVDADTTIHLGGRGLLLVPSYFSRRSCDTYYDTESTPVLVYPVSRNPVVDLRLDSRRSVEQLLGATRTAVLISTDTGRSTSEIARGVGISLAAASRHATVLRSAGLITTLRDGRTALHTLTPLGRSLLDAG
jgi:DNA-binding transcriptional ArsR family regulator